MPARPTRSTKSRLRTQRRILISIGVILASCCACLGGVAILNITGVLNTPTPVLEVDNAATNAVIEALIASTQTADAQIPITGPTNTEASLSTEASSPTATSAPSQTFTPTITNTPAETRTPLPTQTRIPTFTSIPVLPTFDPLQGVTAICNDGSYSYSQHRQGTCSHHGGVKEWVNRPPN